MHKKIAILLGLFIVVFISNILLATRIYAKSERDQQITFILDEIETLSADDVVFEDVDFYVDDENKDKRVAVLKAFFRRHDSPLYDHAEFLVATSDTNGLDYRLIPAISMQESGACKYIPKNSHNCWGWGIYGNTVTRFESYPEAIDTVARGLKKYYIDKGLTTTEQIMSKYNPSSTGSWANGVNTFLEVLE
ncbi:MAG: hypothetical protein ACEQSA_01945 [Weeksellaceae bacterium]